MDIKKVIKQQGYTLEAIATKMSVSKQAMSQLLNGNPTLSKLQEISSIIGIPVSELLREEDEQRSTSITSPHCGQVIKIHVE